MADDLDDEDVTDFLDSKLLTDDLKTLIIVLEKNSKICRFRFKINR